MIYKSKDLIISIATGSLKLPKPFGSYILLMRKANLLVLFFSITMVSSGNLSFSNYTFNRHRAKEEWISYESAAKASQ